MTAIKRFEDIQAWQEARELTRMVYRTSTRGAFAKDYRLRDQIQGSAISVMSNIAEGFGARTDAQFINFLGYARRSATELQCQLYIALDQRYITQEVTTQLPLSAIEIAPEGLSAGRPPAWMHLSA